MFRSLRFASRKKRETQVRRQLLQTAYHVAEAAFHDLETVFEMLKAAYRAAGTVNQNSKSKCSQECNTGTP